MQQPTTWTRVFSLSPRGTSGERVGERGHPERGFLPSPALSSLLRPPSAVAVGSGRELALGGPLLRRTGREERENKPDTLGGYEAMKLLRTFSLGAAVVGLCAMLSGCGTPIGADKMAPSLAYRQIHNNPISHGQPSPETLSALHRF